MNIQELSRANGQSKEDFIASKNKGHEKTKETKRLISQKKKGRPNPSAAARQREYWSELKKDRKQYEKALEEIRPALAVGWTMSPVGLLKRGWESYLQRWCKGEPSSTQVERFVQSQSKKHGLDPDVIRRYVNGRFRKVTREAKLPDIDLLLTFRTIDMQVPGRTQKDVMVEVLQTLGRTSNDKAVTDALRSLRRLRHYLRSLPTPTKKMVLGSRRWTAAEDEFLRSNFTEMTYLQIASRLHRTEDAVKMKAFKLGVRKRQRGVTTGQIAHYVGVDMSTVAGWANRGLLPAPDRHGRDRIFDVSVLKSLPVAKGLTTGEAAKRAGVSSRTVAAWCDKGYVLSVRTLGGVRRIDPGSLNDFLQTRAMAHKGPEKPRLEPVFTH